MHAQGNQRVLRCDLNKNEIACICCPPYPARRRARRVKVASVLGGVHPGVLGKNVVSALRYRLPEPIEIGYPNEEARTRSPRVRRAPCGGRVGPTRRILPRDGDRSNSVLRVVEGE